MKVSRTMILLLLIFLSAFFFRLYFAFQARNYDFDAYFTIRQVENIMQSGVPIYNDPLSYSGRTLFFLPLFHYLLAAAGSLFGTTFAFKILPNLIASTLVLITFFISRDITKNPEVSLVAALLAGFIPVFIYKTLLTVSSYSLVIPLMAFLIYCFMHVERQKFVLLFTAGILVLFLTHPISLVFVLGLLAYIAFVSIERLKHKKAENELVLFAGLFVAWLTLFVYKRPLLEYGFQVIFQNIPADMARGYFSNFSIITSIYEIGLIPFACGIYVIYRYVLRQKRRRIYLFMSLALCLLMLLWAKLVPLQVGLMLLGPILVLLTSQFLKLGMVYFSKTHFHNHKRLLFLGVILAVTFTSLLPSASLASKARDEVASEELIAGLEWLREKTPADSVVLASPDEGYALTAIAHRRNVMDENFLLVPDASQRLADVKTIFGTKYETEAVNLLNKYRVNYILLAGTPDWPAYFSDARCFAVAYRSARVAIVQSLCEVHQA